MQFVENFFDYLILMYMQFNLNFLHFEGLIDVLSANQHAEIFGCMFLQVSPISFFYLEKLHTVILREKLFELYTGIIYS